MRNVTIRQQTGLEEPIIKETEQNQLNTIWPFPKNGRRMITQNSIEVDVETREHEEDQRKTGWKV